MLKKFRECFSKKGQGVVEYALLLGVVAVIVVGFTTDDGLIATFQKTLSNVVGQFTTFNKAYEDADGDEISGTESNEDPNNDTVNLGD